MPMDNIEKTLTKLTALDADELQILLQEESGIGADEEAQGSVVAGVTSIVRHS